MENTMKIQYAIDKDTGLTWSKVGKQIAMPVKDFEKVPAPGESAHFDYKLDKIPTSFTQFFEVSLDWEAKLPKSLKNYHRQYWGLKELK